MATAFHNCNGTTALAAHTRLLAQDLGLRVASVSVDFKQDLQRRFEGHELQAAGGEADDVSLPRRSNGHYS